MTLFRILHRASRCLPLCAAVVSASCGGSPGDPVAPPVQPGVSTVDCSRGTTACARIEIAGDPASPVASYSGFADPSLRADPVLPGVVWMAYSYLDGKAATSAAGGAVGVPVTSTRLAQSSDGGTTWRFQSRLHESALVADPEGLGPPSYFGSETPSLAVRANAGRTTWYSVRIAYFLEPASAYAPRYASSWTLRVAAADGATPAVLATAPEAVLGSTTTASAYGVDVRLTSLNGALADCALWNNPAIVWQGASLKLMVECLEFDGVAVSLARSRMVVFETDAAGAPSTWSWRYVGVLADQALAVEVGGERLVSADVSQSRDGELLLVAALDGGSTGSLGQGCLALELASLSPPLLRRDAQGHLVVRAVQTAAADSDWHTGACSYDPQSATGIVTVAASTSGGGLQAELRSTGLRP